MGGYEFDCFDELVEEYGSIIDAAIAISEVTSDCSVKVLVRAQEALKDEEEIAVETGDYFTHAEALEDINQELETR